jgi:hypothetical protein
VDERWPQETADLLGAGCAQKNTRKTERKAERKQTTSGLVSQQSQAGWAWRIEAKDEWTRR